MLKNQPISTNNYQKISTDRASKYDTIRRSLVNTGQNRPRETGSYWTGEQYIPYSILLTNWIIFQFWQIEFFLCFKITLNSNFNFITYFGIEKKLYDTCTILARFQHIWKHFIRFEQFCMKFCASRAFSK
jgi:hypothetical protein